MIMKQQGFLLVELLISMMILSTVVITFLVVIVPALRSFNTSREYTVLSQALNRKANEIKSLGFWIWDVDTDAPNYPGNAYDPAVKWAADLANFGLSNRGTIQVTFLKEVSGNLVDFSGADFDGNQPRDKVRVELSIGNSLGTTLDQSLVLFLAPIRRHQKSIQEFIRTALHMRFTETGFYPTDIGNFNQMISSYLVEIPNDPYTLEKPKSASHDDEITDWYYDHNTVLDTITFAASENLAASMNWSY